MDDQGFAGVVQGYLNEVVQFRESWQRFALESGSIWERFRSHGAALAGVFLADLQRSQTERCDLLVRVREGTLGVVAAGWQLPADGASLVEIEDSLKLLLRLCQEAERQFRLRQQSAVRLLQSVSELHSSVPDVSVRLLELRRDAERELVFLEGCRHREESQLTVATEPWRALFFLLLDGQRGRAVRGWQGELPELSVSESERYFSLAESRFERWLPLQAVRGLVEFGSESAASVLAALFPEFSAGHERASAAQMERLQLKYGDRSAVTSRLPGAQTVAVPPTSPAVAESVMVSAGAAVRPGVVGGTRRADISTLELLQQQVVTRLLGLGGTLEPRNLWQALSESMLFVLAILKARGDNYGEHRDILEASLHLLAEAQSMLRHWQEQHLPGEVEELQLRVFRWLKEAVALDAEAIRIERYMRLEDVADSSVCGDFLSRLQRESGQWHQTSNRLKNLRLLLEAIRDLGPENSESGWLNVGRFYERFITSGGSPAGSGVREALLEKLDLFPDLEVDGELGAAGDRVCSDALLDLLRQMQSALDEETLRDLEAEPSVGHSWGAEVTEVCQLLRGRRMALVGGVVNQRAREKIERAFGLQYLRWIPASKKDRVKDLEPSIRDVDLLVLVTSIIGHKHNELRSVCVALGIPWVQLPKGSGYGVNQLAHVILQQASRRLRETLAEAG